jgi:hypothetical protein
MGAGSIGAVAAQVVAMAPATTHPEVNA